MKKGSSILAAVGVAISCASPVFLAVQAEARAPEDCALAWGQAVRSYLTQNRTKGPEDEVFKAACEIEGRGDKAAARIEADLIGTKALAKLDPRGCTRFLEIYVEAQRPNEICQAAVQGRDDEALRKMIAGAVPPPKSR